MTEDTAYSKQLNILGEDLNLNQKPVKSRSMQNFLSCIRVLKLQMSLLSVSVVTDNTDQVQGPKHVVGFIRKRPNKWSVEIDSSKISYESFKFIWQE